MNFIKVNNNTFLDKEFILSYSIEKSGMDVVIKEGKPYFVNFSLVNEDFVVSFYFITKENAVKWLKENDLYNDFIKVNEKMYINKKSIVYYSILKNFLKQDNFYYVKFSLINKCNIISYYFKSEKEAKEWLYENLEK